MTRRTMLVCLLAIAILPSAATFAEHTRYWLQSDFADFDKGTPNGVAIRSDGVLVLAPRFDSFSDPNLAYIWSLRTDSHGRLYAAGGSNAKVLRFDDAGKPTTVFESSELSAQAIAFDSKDNLYVGTSPDGKIYQVTPEGKSSVFFDPKTKYIWAMAMDARGNLFVATGDTGQIFVVPPDGKSQLFYQTQERHARALAFDSKGNLLVGTAPNGLLLRIGINQSGPGVAPQAGAAFVVYETGKQEVTSLVADPDGNLSAASVGDKIALPRVPRIIPAPAPQSSAPAISGGATTIVVTPSQSNSALPAAGPPSFPISQTGGSEIVRIAPDGSPRTLWSSRDAIVFSLALSPARKLLLGTGDDGTLFELEDDRIYASVAKTASAQVTSFAAAPDGKIFIATANPGKVFTLGPGYASNGTYESQVFDAKIFSHWGRLTWWGDRGATQGKVAFYIRCGNTSSPEENWSAWAGPYKNAAGEATTCPASRFAQWKVVFSDASQSDPPTISWASLAYLPKNVAPVIDDIAVQNPGIRVVGFPAQVGPAPANPVQLRLPHGPGEAPSKRPTEAVGGEPRIDVPPQGYEQRGYRSVLWSAHDDNDDDLVFTIYFRAEGEQSWHVLKDNVRQQYYAWDTTTMPDGAYYLKIVASDSPSNPSDQALWSDRVSDRIEVANTPPQIVNLRAGSGLLNTKASFDAVSASVPIARAQYSVDAGDWQIVFPTDLLSDSPKESYFMNLPGLPPGDHTLAVRVADRFGNSTAAKVTFTVQPHGPQ
jgi:sugar lactone lactonase YvrE